MDRPADAPPRRRALVVDDDRVTRRYMIDMLASVAFDVYVCDDGEDALVSFARNGPFALVVVDMLLPGMRGTKLVEQLTERDPGVRVLFVSSRVSSVPLGPGRGFLTKPFPTPVFLAEVARLTDTPPPGA